MYLCFVEVSWWPDFVVERRHGLSRFDPRRLISVGVISINVLKYLPCQIIHSLWSDKRKKKNWKSSFKTMGVCCPVTERSKRAEWHWVQKEVQDVCFKSCHFLQIFSRLSLYVLLCHICVFLFIFHLFVATDREVILVLATGIFTQILLWRHGLG